MKEKTVQNFFTVRKAQPEDIPAIHSLVRELALFEKEPDAVITNPEEYLKDMESNWFESIVACSIHKEIAGMALFHRAYSSWKGKMIYLDDLIVTEKFRGQGAGRLLLDSLIQYAKTQDARLLKWQVLDWNTDAINFYKELGVDFEDEWLNCKMFLSK